MEMKTGHVRLDITTNNCLHTCMETCYVGEKKAVSLADTGFRKYPGFSCSPTKQQQTTTTTNNKQQQQQTTTTTNNNNNNNNNSNNKNSNSNNNSNNNEMISGQ